MKESAVAIGCLLILAVLIGGFGLFLWHEVGELMGVFG